jgi:hypothetical protein
MNTDTKHLTNATMSRPTDYYDDLILFGYFTLEQCANLYEWDNKDNNLREKVTYYVVDRVMNETRPVDSFLGVV